MMTLVDANVIPDLVTDDPAWADWSERAFARLPLPWDAAHAAGQAFLRYRRRGGANRSPLPDFYIGAHAMVAGMRLITRDEARYRTYFPSLALITP